MTPLAIRVEAGPGIGSGHVMRCLALAHAWEEPSTFVMSARDARVEAAGSAVVPLDALPGSRGDAHATIAAARAAGADWLVIDGYMFDVAYQRTVRAAGLHTLCVDDNGEAGSYAADIILNQNLHASQALYARRAEPATLLLGPRYVLMRSEFAASPAPAPVVPQEARRVLVTLGGGAEERLLVTILEGLARTGIDELDVTVLTGGVRSAGIDAAAARIGGTVRLLEGSDRMRALMADADLAISAGGSTTWELAFMGVPSALVVVAPNQAAAAAASVAQGIAVPLGDAAALTGEEVARQVRDLALDAQRRARMSAAGQALIDGQGAARVVAAMRAHPGVTAAVEARTDR
jgi:UDP-2,4-diacetamido-2,4,6-trideoxy-beta-L-altropyranose hydrolase